MSCFPPRPLRSDICSIKAPFKHLGCLRFLSGLRPLPLKLWDLFQIPGFAVSGFLPLLLPQARGIATAMRRSEEHTSELRSLMRTSYAVFCLKTKKQQIGHERTYS